jgi:hypothetical protein
MHPHTKHENIKNDICSSQSFTVQLGKNLNNCFEREQFAFKNIILCVPGSSIIDKVKVSIVRFHWVLKFSLNVALPFLHLS